MKKIITAMGNPNLNQKLKKENIFEMMAEDIQYQEGILEFLEENNNIDFVILSELLPGNIEIKKLIEKIKLINQNIKIILFLEKKNEELENYLYAKGIFKIFYHNQIGVKEIIELMQNNSKNSTQEIKKEIDELKKLLLEKNKKEKKMNLFFKNNIENNEKNNEKNNAKNHKNKIIKNNAEKNSKNQRKEIICVSGTSGVGKSIFSINLAKSFMNEQNKILIIDFDILNNSLHTILGIKKYPEKVKNKIKNNNLLSEIKIEELIIKINSKIDLISGINLLFDSKYQISSAKIKNILLKLKEKYNLIIIDTSSECFFDYTKEIMKNSNYNIFITEANLLEIKKAKNLLNIYINEWEIPQRNFNILFNKYNQNSIDVSILKHIFSGFSILGKLSINPQYNLMINKNDKKILDKNLQKEYSTINKKILHKKEILNNIRNKKYFSKMLYHLKNKSNKKLLEK